MQHCEFVIPQVILKGITNNIGVVLVTLDHNLQLLLSKTIRIGNT